MFKKIYQKIWYGIQIIFVYVVAVPVVYALMWYSENIDGVEPKTGSPYQKSKTVNGLRYSKRSGLKNIFKPWTLVKYSSHISDLDIYSMYPVWFKENKLP